MSDYETFFIPKKVTPEPRVGLTDDEVKALIDDLRLNHEYCPKEVILKAANVIEELTHLLKPPTKIVGPNLEGILNQAGFYRKPPPSNFCPRCGNRRGGDVNYIHTCTPPRGLEMT